MITDRIKKSLSIILEYYKLDANEFLLKEEERFNPGNKLNDPEEILKSFIRFGIEHDLILMNQSVPLAEFKEWFEGLNYPVILLEKEEETYIPVIMMPNVKKKGNIIVQKVYGNNTVVSEVSSYPAHELYCAMEDGITNLKMLTCFPRKNLFTEGSLEDAKWPLIKRFGVMLRHERKDIGYILLYAVIAGVIGLSLPLGVQSIVSFVSSGQIVTSVVVLIIFILLGLLISGGMQIMQLYLAEHIQQRLFAKTAFEFAFRIPRIKLESVLKEYPPELINRFFDVITLQKGTATLLLEFSAAILQILFGLILLSLYHPAFIILGMILVTVLFFVLRVTGPRGMSSSIKESKYKYKIANWLEELARSITTFKLSGDSTLPIDRTDHLVSNYLHARGKHFKVLAGQYLAFVLFKTLITGALLIAGCIMIVQKEINLGQFIASEIVIILIMGSVEKIILKLDVVYDVLTSIDKISHVTDIPLERNGSLLIPNADQPISVSLKNLNYKFPDRKDKVINDLDLDIASGEHICIAGSNGSGKSSLINIMLGMLDNWEGNISYNGVPMRDLDRNYFLSHVGDYVAHEALFDATVLENITLGRKRITVEDVTAALECAGLMSWVQSLPDGLQTRLTGGNVRVPGSIERKLIIARSIVGKPSMLMLDDLMLGVERNEKLRIMKHLVSPQYKRTIIVVSNDPIVMENCKRTVIMKNGKIVADGTFSEIVNSSYYQEIQKANQ